MRKSIHSKDYQLMIALLRKERQAKQMTQAAVAAAFGITASQLSKWERLDRRLDISEVRLYCRVLGISFQSFIVQWDRLVEREELDTGRLILPEENG